MAEAKDEGFDWRIILYVSLPALVLGAQLFFTFSRDAFIGARPSAPRLWAPATFVSGSARASSHSSQAMPTCRALRTWTLTRLDSCDQSDRMCPGSCDQRCALRDFEGATRTGHIFCGAALSRQSGAHE